MGTNEPLTEVEEELLRAEHILNTDFSFDLAEPNYLACIKVIERFPALQSRLEALLIDLFYSRRVSDEPVAYLMYKLRWPGVLAWMEAQFSNLPNPIVGGERYDNVIAAYSDSWENREFYKGL